MNTCWLWDINFAFAFYRFVGSNSFACAINNECIFNDVINKSWASFCFNHSAQNEIAPSKLIITSLFLFTTQRIVIFLQWLRQRGMRTHEPQTKKKNINNRMLIRKSRESMRMNKDDCVFLRPNLNGCAEEQWRLKINARKNRTWKKCDLLARAI